MLINWDSLALWPLHVRLKNGTFYQQSSKQWSMVVGAPWIGVSAAWSTNRWVENPTQQSNDSWFHYRINKPQSGSGLWLVSLRVLVKYSSWATKSTHLKSLLPKEDQAALNPRLLFLYLTVIVNSRQEEEDKRVIDVVKGGHEVRWFERGGYGWMEMILLWRPLKRTAEKKSRLWLRRGSSHLQLN